MNEKYLLAPLSHSCPPSVANQVRFSCHSPASRPLSLALPIHSTRPIWLWLINSEEEKLPSIHPPHSMPPAARSGCALPPALSSTGSSSWRTIKVVGWRSRRQRRDGGGRRGRADGRTSARERERCLGLRASLLSADNERPSLAKTFTAFFSIPPKLSLVR